MSRRTIAVLLYKNLRVASQQIETSSGTSVTLKRDLTRNKERNQTLIAALAAQRENELIHYNSEYEGLRVAVTREHELTVEKMPFR